MGFFLFLRLSRAYQIDFFPVGDGSKSGDAIAMRFGDLSDPTKNQVVVIDGGFQSSGEARAGLHPVHG